MKELALEEEGHEPPSSGRYKNGPWEPVSLILFKKKGS